MSSTTSKGPPKRTRIRGNAQKQANTSNLSRDDPIFESLQWESNKYVVNVRKDTPDVYVGRRNPKYPPETCDNYKWGNPFKMTKTQSREEVCRKYQQYLDENEELKQEAKRELKGKRLGCWCYPQMCHAMFLAKVANED